MSNKKFFILFAYLFLAQISSATAQLDLENFNYWLKENKLVYQQPASYSAIDYTGNFAPDANFFLTRIFLSIKNNTKDLVIGLAPVPIFQDDKESLTYKLFPSDANKNWLVDIKVEADTSVFKPSYYGKDQLALLNADNAVLYQLKMKQVFLEKYTYCKVLIIHKEHISDTQLFYFYNDSSKDIVDDQIKMTYGVLRFK